MRTDIPLRRPFRRGEVGVIGVVFALTVAAFGPAAMLVADDWPQWLGPRRDGVWRESGLISEFPNGGLDFRWRVSIGSGYSGPAVAGGRVLVMDRVTDQQAKPGEGGSGGSAIPGQERVLCFDQGSGELLWKHTYRCAYTISYAAGPRATPAVSENKVYTLGSEGDVFCLELGSGRVVWRRDLKADFSINAPTWGFAGQPLVDGDKLIMLVGGEGSVVVAFNKETGVELWRALTAKEPGYAPPMIYSYGGKRQLILWHPEAVSGLDPETGGMFWTHKFARSVQFGMTISTPRQVDDCLFLTSFYNGSVLLRIQDGPPSVVWQSKKVSEKDTDGLHTVMATPLIQDGYIYGPCSYGQFRCLELGTGTRVWETYAPTSGRAERWGNAFVVPQGERVFILSETGDLIMARLSPDGYRELGRVHLIDPDNQDAGRSVVWSHPAFANRCVYARNDREMVCVNLAAD